MIFQENNNLNCSIFRMNSIKIIQVNLITMKMRITIKQIMEVNSAKKTTQKKNQQGSKANLKIIKEIMKKEMNILNKKKKENGVIKSIVLIIEMKSN